MGGLSQLLQRHAGAGPLGRLRRVVLDDREVLQIQLTLGATGTLVVAAGAANVDDLLDVRHDLAVGIFGEELGVRIVLGPLGHVLGQQEFCVILLLGPFANPQHDRIDLDLALLAEFLLGSGQVGLVLVGACLDRLRPARRLGKERRLHGAAAVERAMLVRDDQPFELAHRRLAVVVIDHVLPVRQELAGLGAAIEMQLHQCREVAEAHRGQKDGREHARRHLQVAQRQRGGGGERGFCHGRTPVECLMTKD